MKKHVLESIAYTFSMSKKKVLLIDSDLRNPSLHKRLKRDNAIGLGIAIGGCGIEHVLVGWVACEFREHRVVKTGLFKRLFDG